MWSKFAEVQCAFAVAEHLLQFCGICGCGIECKFVVPSSANGDDKERIEVHFFRFRWKQRNVNTEKLKV